MSMCKIIGIKISLFDGQSNWTWLLQLTMIPLLVGLITIVIELLTSNNSDNIGCKKGIICHCQLKDCIVQADLAPTIIRIAQFLLRASHED